MASKAKLLPLDRSERPLKPGSGRTNFTEARGARSNPRHCVMRRGMVRGEGLHGGPAAGTHHVDAINMCDRGRRVPGLPDARQADAEAGHDVAAVEFGVAGEVSRCRHTRLPDIDRPAFGPHDPEQAYAAIEPAARLVLQLIAAELAW